MSSGYLNHKHDIYSPASDATQTWHRNKAKQYFLLDCDVERVMVPADEVQDLHLHGTSLIAGNVDWVRAQMGVGKVNKLIWTGI